MKDRKMTLYVNEKDRQEIECLIQSLEKQGIAGITSVSGLFRYLRQKELVHENDRKQSQSR